MQGELHYRAKGTIFISRWPIPSEYVECCFHNTERGRVLAGSLRKRGSDGGGLEPPRRRDGDARIRIGLLSVIIQSSESHHEFAISSVNGRRGTARRRDGNESSVDYAAFETRQGKARRGEAHDRTTRQGRADNFRCGFANDVMVRQFSPTCNGN